MRQLLLLVLLLVGSLMLVIGGVKLGKELHEQENAELVKMWQDKVNELELACNVDHLIQINQSLYICMPAQTVQKQQQPPEIQQENQTWIL
jgi:hypothetical protein